MKALLERIEMFVEEKDSEYQKFFKKKLKEFGVDEPDKLSKEDKKKFYDEIEKEWDKEEDHDDDENLDEALKKDNKTNELLYKLIDKKESIEKSISDKWNELNSEKVKRQNKGSFIKGTNSSKELKLSAQITDLYKALEDVYKDLEKVTNQKD